MSINSPATYADHYWAKQVEAAKSFDEGIEQLFAPFWAGYLNNIPELNELPVEMLALVDLLKNPISPGLGGFTLGVGVEMVDEVLHTTLEPMMSIMRRAMNRSAREKWLTAQQANTLYSRRKIDDALWDLVVSSEGYEDVIGNFLYRSELPYPTIPDLMLWARYHGHPTNTRQAVWEKFDVPTDDYDLFEWLTLQRLTTQDAHTLYRRGLITLSEVETQLQRIGWRDDDVLYQTELNWLLPNAMLVLQGDLHQRADRDKIYHDLTRADIHPDWVQTYYDAVMTKPSTIDLTAFELRRDPSLSGLAEKLIRVGVHPEYTDVYKELAYVIPPVADIITMAVREVFSPEIAQRFGQYEDYPEALDTWATKKGLSSEWAQRYWAAHWGLPSVTQGFEMLHRGIITLDEMNLLLRAQDVMPFWRDKLIQMAYKPLTRVDVRRMYNEGVLDEGGVYKAYLDLGYNEENAERMTEFTVAYSLSQQAKFSSSDVVKAFTERLINRSEAHSLLIDLGIKSKDADWILSKAEYKRLWALTEERIKAIKNLYKRGVYDENIARAKLLQLDMPSEQVDVLYEQWYFEKEGQEKATFTKAETISFLKKGFITVDRAVNELKLLNYDDEHIDIYLRSVA